MPPALLTALNCQGDIHLIIGSNSLASARCAKSLEIGAKPKVIVPPETDVYYGLVQRIENGEVERIDKTFEAEDLCHFGREEVDGIVDAVFVTSGGKSTLSTEISQLCRRKRIPVNVVDAPNLCTFTLLSTHSDGPLQIGITTSGKGCKLAARIRREIASSLPPKFGDAVDRLGAVRRRIWEEDHRSHLAEELSPDVDEDENAVQKSTFNRLISESDSNQATTRRMRWLSQICEYWPLRRLASITDADVDEILQCYVASAQKSQSGLQRPSGSVKTGSKPQIILAGSGPGNPDLLTVATHRAIQSASVILADKLVPAPVLDLIPRRTPVHIARKFPGNAEAAQAELLHLGLEALSRGESVLRLKQGDPYIYGRGGEEYAFFREKGFTPVVLPGITSALSAPLFAAIPPTHRSVADQVLICTGTGRKGAAPEPPPYVPSQTVVFLMALHRLSSLIEALTGSIDKTTIDKSKSEAKHWPRETPCAVVERASCPDQRVIRSTLEHVCTAVEEEGSRPPGLLVVGWACEVLVKIKGRGPWIIEEGFFGFDNMICEDMKALEDLKERIRVPGD